MSAKATKGTGQRIAYIRVSTLEQNPARQYEAVGKCDQIFEERESGRSAGNRPRLEALIQYIRAGDHVVVASMDRLARSVVDLNDLVHQITGDPAHHSTDSPSKGATLEFLKEGLTFAPGHTDPMAAFQLNTMGAVAQFERELIRHRQAEGIAAAKKRGAYKGRPRALTPEQIHEIRNAALAGQSKTQIARDFKISRSTLYRYLDD